MPTSPALSAADLLAFLQDDLALAEPLDSETELFSAGLLDSVGMMQVIAFLEERGGIDVRPADVTLDNFDSVSRIMAYVASLA